jgi:hypothetical protein
MRIAIVIPGIMGSALFYRDASGQQFDLWSDRLSDNYRRLLENPAVLNWDGRVANATVMESVAPLPVVPYRISLWGRISKLLGEHAEFGAPGGTIKFGYDWRCSLVQTGAQLGETLARRADEASDAGASDVRFTFVTHSMGGLVARVALALQSFPIGTVDKIVHIGSPLLGAPSAFGAAYGDGRLPLLRELSVFLYRRKNGSKFFQMLLECIQTFPSLYQMLPPRNYRFILEKPGFPLSPFQPSHARYIPARFRKHAEEARALLDAAGKIISSESIATHTIYTDHHRKRGTEIEFVVRPIGPDLGYEIRDLLPVPSGDGTVPRESAMGEGPRPVASVAHMDMCNDRRVTDILRTVI